jgi:hypothetical protein
MSGYDFKVIDDHDDLTNKNKKNLKEMIVNGELFNQLMTLEKELKIDEQNPKKENDVKDEGKKVVENKKEIRQIINNQEIIKQKIEIPKDEIQNPKVIKENVELPADVLKKLVFVKQLYEDSLKMA